MFISQPSNVGNNPDRAGCRICKLRPFRGVPGSAKPKQCSHGQGQFDGESLNAEDLRDAQTEAGGEPDPFQNQQPNSLEDAG
jgi:hypothetical protein